MVVDLKKKKSSLSGYENERKKGNSPNEVNLFCQYSPGVAPARLFHIGVRHLASYGQIKGGAVRCVLHPIPIVVTIVLH